MTDFLPAYLIPLGPNNAKQLPIVGDAIVGISRDDRGEVEFSGTFRSTATELKPSQAVSPLLYRYDGLASEGERRCKVEVLVLVTEHENDLYELTSKGHAINLEWLD